MFGFRYPIRLYYLNRLMILCVDELFSKYLKTMETACDYIKLKPFLFHYIDLFQLTENGSIPSDDVISIYSQKRKKQTRNRNGLWGVGMAC